MKIAIINGQSHKGSTQTIGTMLAHKLARKDCITEFFLPRDLNYFCLGCYACLEDESRCPYYSEKSRLLAAMEEADLIIFTTPNYCMAPSAPMKSFLDMMFTAWMVHKPKPWMFKKRAVVISTSAGASCKGVLKVMKTSLSGWGIPIILTLGLPVHAMSFDGIDKRTRTKIEKKLCTMAKKLNTTKPPRVGIGIRLNFAFMRLLHIKGWDSSPTEAQYWSKQGWLGRSRPWKKDNHSATKGDCQCR